MWKTTPIAALLLLAAACVYAPESGTFYDVNATEQFAGIASTPGASMELHAFNKQSRQWMLLTTSEASSSPVVFNDDRIHYYWTIRHQLTSRADWRCFVHETCFIPDAGVYEVRYQVREVPESGDATVLFTYDEGGLSCWLEHYRNGADLYAAYWPCRANDPDEVRLQTILTF